VAVDYNAGFQSAVAGAIIKHLEHVSQSDLKSFSNIISLGIPKVSPCNCMYYTNNCKCMYP
jgi:hypothetical protein